MPSLRRTASSPAVRASPYHSSAARVRHKKRPLASESSVRRVLADIDWWKVTEGQCDPNVDDADDARFDENRGQGLIGDIPLDLDAAVGHLSTHVPLPWDFAATEDIAEVCSKSAPE